MPNWNRTPPKSGMSVEEIKRRVKDGIKNREKTGEILPERKPLPGQSEGFMLQAHGPRMNKQQRVACIHAANLAIMALCEEDPLDYCQAAETINAVRRQAGFKTEFMQHMLKGVAHEAAEITGEKFVVLDTLARRWLSEYFAPSGKVISIAKKGKTNGHDKNESIDQPGPTPSADIKPESDD